MKLTQKDTILRSLVFTYERFPLMLKRKTFFYLRPLPSIPTDSSKLWFTSTPVRKNTLNNVLKQMYQKAGTSQQFTNHSLQAFGATKLFQAAVSVKMIQQRTGHQSLEALCQYECTSSAQLLDVSNVLSNFTDDSSPRTSESCNPSSPTKENNKNNSQQLSLMAAHLLAVH